MKDDAPTGAGDTPRTAVVLAGGGFKGAFELGAFRYLVHRQGVVPDVITATSAGAILGTVAAQARTHEELLGRLEEADADLMAMTQVDRVFGEQPWLQELDGTPAADRIRKLVTDRGRPHPEDDDTASPGDGGGHGSHRHHRNRDADRHPFVDAVEVARRLPAAHRAKADGPGRAILNLGPFETSLRGGTDVGIAPLDADLVARPGLDLRLAVTDVKGRATHYVTGDARLVGPDALTPVPDATGFDLVDGVIASASVPGVFPPRLLGPATYVDGGVLQNIPLAAALALRPDRVFTLVAVPVRQPKKSVSLWAAEELGYFSTQVDNLAVPLPPGVTNTVIEPTLEVVGSFELHRGLMRIDIDYGWLRCEETLADLDDGLRPVMTTASDTIIKLRQRAWLLEERCLDGTDVAATVAELRGVKAALRSARAARGALGLPCPSFTDEFGHGWELHGRERPADLPETFD
ncbi:MAG: patatin-like phospholipase family protein [Microthrixaceae bacterium]